MVGGGGGGARGQDPRYVITESYSGTWLVCKLRGHVVCRRVGLQKRNSVFKMPKPHVSKVEFNWELFETEFYPHMPFDCQVVS